MTAAIPWTNTPRRRGDTCVARMTAAISQFAGTTAYTAQRNATDGSCRSGTGRHKWRPYVHRRASSRRNAGGTTAPAPSVRRNIVAGMHVRGVRKKTDGRAVMSAGMLNFAPRKHGPVA